MATDQEIRDAGLKYIPQQKYLQNPFELPVEPESPVVNQGIVNTNAFTGGGGGNDFSVYNPDPNSIVNRDYRPNYDYRKSVDYDPSLSATANEKQFDMAQNYYNRPPPSKLEGLMGMIPYAGSFMRGANFLGNQISPYLPVNRRRIMENELGGQGVMVNSIGQIVSGGGDYNTAANVMAGYNPYHMTAKTFDDRITMAKNKMSADTPAAKKYKDKRIAALKEAKTNFLGAQSKTDKIYDFEEDEKEKKKKDTIVGRFLTKRKEKKADKVAADAAATAKAQAIADANRPYSGPTYRNEDGSAISQDFKNTTASLRNYDADVLYAKGGRVGYFFGGRVNFKHGGLASIL